jgi:hypothetical protein
MYDQSKLSDLIRFSRIDAGSTVIDVYPGDGDWTRLFSDIVGPEGRVYSFVPAEVAHFKNDPVGAMRVLAKEPGRENVDAVSADLVALPEATRPADVLWLHLFYHDLHTALIRPGARRRPTSIEPSTTDSSLQGSTSSSITPPPPERARAMPRRCIAVFSNPEALFDAGVDLIIGGFARRLPVGARGAWISKSTKPRPHKCR